MAKYIKTEQGYKRADEIENLATEAYADNVHATAINAQNSANTAQSKADSAYSLANTAYSNAQQAEATGSRAQSIALQNSSKLLTTSTVHHPYDNGTIWKKIISGDGRYLAIERTPSTGASTNRYAFSSDGINWFQYTLSAVNYIMDATYGNGRFVVTTGGTQNRIYYSVDGVNWYVTDLSSAGLHSIHSVDGKFVAASAQHMYYSEDGINWTHTAEFNCSPTTTWTILRSTNKWVAVGVASGLFQYVASSSDGVEWQFETLSKEYVVEGSVYGGDRFMLFTGSGFLIYSTDGVAWKRGASFDMGNPLSICYGAGTFIVSFVASNRLAYTTDGINITYKDYNIKEGVLHFDGEKFISMSQSSNQVAYSYDGYEWSSIQFIQNNEIVTDTVKNVVLGSNKLATEEYVDTVSQKDWSQTDETKSDYIKNKPTNISAFTNDAGYLTEASKEEILNSVAPAIQYGTTEVTEGAASPYPEGTLYVVIS